MASARTSRLLLLGLLATAAVAAPRPSDVLGDPYPVAAGRFRFRPPQGLRAQDPRTPGIEAFFVGEVAQEGSASVLVMYVPGSTGLPTYEGALGAYAAEVAGGLEEGRVEAASLGEDGRVEIELTLRQFVGGESRRMFMLQHQIPHDDGLFNLTAVCLASARERLGPILRASLASFHGATPEPPRARVRAPSSPVTGNPAALVAAASQAMAEARLAEALRLAEGVDEDAPFLQRVGAYRIRLSAHLALGQGREARELLPAYIQLWRSDDRPFSAHYSAMLRRGLSLFLQRLHELERSELEEGARAALGQVALTAWAGPADMVPPRITATQDQLFALLRSLPMGQGGAWQALTPALEKAAAEVEGFLRETASEGTVLAPDADDYRWLESSLFLPLVVALRRDDPRKYREILRLFSRVGPSAGELAPGPGSALEALARGDVAQGRSFTELAYRIWETSGTEVYERTRRLLEEEGLVGLVQRSAAVMGPTP